MLVVGLTGSMGMGKSAIAAMLRTRGIAVFDADAEVHRLYEGSAVDAIAAAFPGTVTGGKVDRTRLAARLAADAGGFERLEKIVHPLVRDAERAFLQAEARGGAALAVLEVPLLFETGRDRLCDAVIVVHAKPEVQRRRLRDRPGMTDVRLELLLARQMPEAEKLARADFVVDTNGSHQDSERQVDTILDSLKSREARALAAHWM